MLYLAEENSTGDLYFVEAKNDEDAYHVFAKKVMGNDVDDTGNVDINLLRVPTLKAGIVKKVTFD